MRNKNVKQKVFTNKSKGCSTHASAPNELQNTHQPQAIDVKIHSRITPSEKTRHRSQRCWRTWWVVGTPAGKERPGQVTETPPRTRYYSNIPSCYTTSVRCHTQALCARVGYDLECHREGTLRPRARPKMSYRAWSARCQWANG